MHTTLIYYPNKINEIPITKCTQYIVQPIIIIGIFYGTFSLDISLKKIGIGDNKININTKGQLISE